MGKNALTNGVDPQYVEPVSGGSSANLLLYSKNKTSCKESCKLIVAENESVDVKIVGNLKIKDHNQVVTNYGIPENDVTIYLYSIVEGFKKRIGVGSYDGQGNLEIKAKSLSNSIFKALIEIRDPTGNYQPNDIDLNINTTPSKALSLGDINLLTLSGKGCKNINDFPGTRTCFSK